MSHFERHKELYDKPIYLCQEEEAAPLLAIKRFFDDYRLSEIREIHENVLNVCLTCNIPPFDDPETRDRLIHFREQEEKVLEAILLLLKHINSAPKEIMPIA